MATGHAGNPRSQLPNFNELRRQSHRKAGSRQMCSGVENPKAIVSWGSWERQMCRCSALDLRAKHNRKLQFERKNAEEI